MKKESSTVSSRPCIVIVGAGFAGVRAAKKLSGIDAEITLVDRNNYHTFIPLLYQVATGFISASTIAYPIRNLLRRIPRTQFVLAEVQKLDLENQAILTDGPTLTYDYLLLATGSQTRFLQVPGAPEHTFALRTLEDAIALRHQIFLSLETAAKTGNTRYLTFVIVGGGPTGVELAGSLQELLSGPVQKDYPTLDLSQAQIVLVQSANALLPSFPEKMQRYTLKQLVQRGVEVRLQTRVSAVDTAGVELSDGRRISAATVIWTAGVLANKPELAQPEDWDEAALNISEQGKVAVESSLQLTNYPNVYVTGDVARVEQNGEVLFGVAPEALQQGGAAANNIRRQIKGQAPQPFEYFDKGRAAIIARHAGVAYLLSKISITGPLGWLTWLVIHLYYLPGLTNRMALLNSWLRDYIWQGRAHRQILPTPVISSEQRPI